MAHGVCALGDKAFHCLRGDAACGRAQRQRCRRGRGVQPSCWCLLGPRFVRYVCGTMPCRTWPPPASPWWSSWGSTRWSPGPPPCGSTRCACPEALLCPCLPCPCLLCPACYAPLSAVWACGRVDGCCPLPARAAGAALLHPRTAVAHRFLHHPISPTHTNIAAHIPQVTQLLGRPLHRQQPPIVALEALEAGWGMSITQPPPPRGSKGHLAFVAVRLGALWAGCRGALRPVVRVHIHTVPSKHCFVFLFGICFLGVQTHKMPSKQNTLQSGGGAAFCGLGQAGDGRGDVHPPRC